MVLGVEIWYALEECRSAGDLVEAPSSVDLVGGRVAILLGGLVHRRVVLVGSEDKIGRRGSRSGCKSSRIIGGVGHVD